jgi:hypothetical protein
MKGCWSQTANSRPVENGSLASRPSSPSQAELVERGKPVIPLNINSGGQSQSLLNSTHVTSYRCPYGEDTFPMTRFYFASAGLE